VKRAEPSVHDFRLGIGILVGSGIAALGNELLWTRRMIDLLGASGESCARVFECFFLGLSLGAAISSLQLTKIRRPWYFLGAVEVGIALFCLPALLLPQWTSWIWPTLGPARLLAWEGATVKTVLSALILLPPTILMGMTLPVMASAVIPRNTVPPPSREIHLSAANTFGGEHVHASEQRAL
jgi:hypothetical protein